MNVTVEQIKAFRAKTGYKISDCKEALIACNGDEGKAKEYIMNKWKNKIDNWN